MAAQGKMFVHYKGTVAAFKEAGLESVYNHHIVFIKGGEADGKGEAVYTHGQYYGNVKDALAALQAKVDGMKYFSKISDGSTVASVASAEGTITIKGEDPAIVTLIDKEGLKIGLSDTFKTAVNTTLPNAVSAIESKLGSKDATAASGADASAFGRIKNLETIVAGLTGSEGGNVESVDAKINNAIGALDVDAVAGDYVAFISQVDGKIVPVMGNFEFDAEGAADQALQDAKDYADGKFQVAGNYEAAGAAAQALQDAKDYADGLAGNYEVAGAAAEVQGKLDTEVSRAKAAEEANASAIAAEKARLDAFLADATISEAAVDTLKEIQAYITSDGTAAQEMLAAIEAAQGAADAAQGEVDALEGVVAGVKATADAAATQVALQAEINRADAAEKANAAAIKAVADDYLKGADKTELSGLISAEVTTARAAEKANADAIDAIEADYLKSADKTELQGNIDAKVAQSAYDAKIAALEAKDAELASFWAWEEL